MLYLILIIFILFCVYILLFYPTQKLSIGEIIDIVTPQEENYHNDCLHPCIREVPEGFCGYTWIMVQTPYYGNNNKLENPILYGSVDETYPKNWTPLCVVKETPSKGFNSDATIYYEAGKLFVFWREVNTPLCDELGVSMTTVGVSTTDCLHFSPAKVYLTNKHKNYDLEQSPVLIKKNENYLFYAVHYQYYPFRRNIGLTLWVGSNLDKPDFLLKKQLKLPKAIVCDKLKQFRIFKKIIFVPKPLQHDVWHIDIFEYNSILYLFTCAEFGDNLVLYQSINGNNFTVCRKPLVNAHKSETKWNFRPYFYKPTGFIKDNILFLYYTTKTPENPLRNVLFLSKNKL